MGCLDNIVGLSRKDCECYTDDRPDGWNESKSGIYLDELPGLTQAQINSSIECGDGSIWDIMERALENGERKFRTDLLSNLRQRFKERYLPFNGVIGMSQKNGSPAVDNLMGLRIESNCIKGSCLTLKGIDTFFDTDIAALEVNIYRSGTEAPIHTFNVEAVAFEKKTNTLATPIELPLWIDGTDEFSYSIVYTLPPGVKPLNNKLYTCSCDRKSSAWSVWATVDGIKTSAFTTTYALDNLSGTSYTYGLNLSAEIECKKGSIICEDGEDWDFKNDDIALQIATAIQSISAVHLLLDILTRPDTVAVAINEEQTNALISMYSEDYENRIEYLALNIDPNNDCFICSNQMKGVGILA